MCWKNTALGNHYLVETLKSSTFTALNTQDPLGTIVRWVTQWTHGGNGPFRGVVYLPTAGLTDAPESPMMLTG
jgi:hypothetical protein